MRANPQLFGMPVEGTGFAGQEYQAAYALYNQSVIRPSQKAFVNVMDKIFDAEATVSIVPFQSELPTETE